MAKKFNELNGVILQHKITNERRLLCNPYENDHYDILNEGDLIFVVDPTDKKIDKCRVKQVQKYSDGTLLIKYCNFLRNRDFKPTHFGMSTPLDITTTRVMAYKSVYGLLSTNLNDAANKLQKIKEGKYLGSLKCDDKIYIVDKINECVIEETVKRCSFKNTQPRYYDDRSGNIKTENYIFRCSYSEYNESSSIFNDTLFTVWKNGKLVDAKKFSIYLDKTMAERVLREYVNAKRNYEKKKSEKLKPLKGTPIQHKDNKGNELHYGDRVSYVRKGWHGHTDISIGTIVGESKLKIKVFDREEGKEGLIHLLEKENVLRI